MFLHLCFFLFLHVFLHVVFRVLTEHVDALVDRARCWFSLHFVRRICVILYYEWESLPYRVPKSKISVLSPLGALIVDYTKMQEVYKHITQS